jgi:hypothetical protein
MLITEPTTTLTDYAIAIVAFILTGFLLRVGWRRQQISVCLWAIAFGCVAIAAALGGTCHGFTLILGEPTSTNLWQIMIYTLSLASFAMLAGTFFSSVSKRWRPWALLAAMTKSAVVWISLIRLPEFEVVAIDYVAAMVIVLLLQFHALTDASTGAARWLVAGILISGVAVAILGSGLTVAQFFNHTDCYHLVQLFGLGLLYQGAKQLKDR